MPLSLWKNSLGYRYDTSRHKSLAPGCHRLIKRIYSQSCNFALPTLTEQCQVIIRTGGEHQVGQADFSVITESLDAGFIHNQTQLIELLLWHRRFRDNGEVFAEIGLSATGAVDSQRSF